METKGFASECAATDLTLRKVKTTIVKFAS